MIGSLAHFLLYKKLPPMDQYHRPTMFYGNILHDNCQRRQYFDNGKFARVLSEPYCLLELGCKGPFAACDSYKRLWNGGVNSCILANGPCYACTDMNFPDGSSPIYQRYTDMKLPGIRRQRRRRWGHRGSGCGARHGCPPGRQCSKWPRRRQR
jgi:hydrogenase small subunit